MITIQFCNNKQIYLHFNKVYDNIGLTLCEECNKKIFIDKLTNFILCDMPRISFDYNKECKLYQLQKSI